MRHTRTKSLAPAAYMLLLLLLAAPAALGVRAQTTDRRSRAVPANAPEIAYIVSMPRPHTHLFEVEARLRYKRRGAARSVDLVMPVWTPGSYLVREFGRHVQDFAAAGRRRARARVGEVEQEHLARRDGGRARGARALLASTRTS